MTWVAVSIGYRNATLLFFCVVSSLVIRLPTSTAPVLCGATSTHPEQQTWLTMQSACLYLAWPLQSPRRKGPHILPFLSFLPGFPASIAARRATLVP